MKQADYIGEIQDAVLRGTNADNAEGQYRGYDEIVSFIEGNMLRSQKQNGHRLYPSREVSPRSGDKRKRTVGDHM